MLLQGFSDPKFEDKDEEERKMIQDDAKYASNIMRIISNTSEGKKVIIFMEAVPHLTCFLHSKAEKVRCMAIPTLHNVLLVKDERNRDEVEVRDKAKQAIRSKHGGTALVRILHTSNEEKLLTIVTDCLRILAVTHEGTKQEILENNGPQILVNIMKHHSYENLLMTTSRLLKGKAK